MCTANLSNVLPKNERTERVRRSSVRGRTLSGLATALCLPQGPQVAHRGGVDHHCLAGPLESNEATRGELLRDARERFLDDDDVVLREEDARFLCHGTTVLRVVQPLAKQMRAAEAAPINARAPPGLREATALRQRAHLLHDLLHFRELFERPVPIGTDRRSCAITDWRD